MPHTLPWESAGVARIIAISLDICLRTGTWLALVDGFCPLLVA